MPAIYQQPLPGSARTASHVTLRLPAPQALAEVVKAVWALTLHPAVRRAQMGFPRPAWTTEREVPDAPSQRGPAAGAPQRSGKQGTAPRPKVLLGVLEDACPFGHAALQTQWGTRVAALWDQGHFNTPSAATPADFGYGRVLQQHSLQALIRRHSDAGNVDEEALYRDPAALQPRLHAHGSHAAAVIGLLAGRDAYLPSYPHSHDRPERSTDRPHRSQAAQDDPAAKAPLAVVQFPREQVDLAGARWMVVRALDGLRFLAQTSADLAAPGQPPLPLVANLSYGSVVGAHDGTALIETAMAELAQAHPNMAIVLAAGNSHGTQRQDEEGADVAQRRPSGRHADCAALGPGQHTVLALAVSPNKPIESYLEIWFSPVKADAQQSSFLAAGEVDIEVISPTGQRLHIDHWPGVALDHPRPSRTGAALIGLQRVAQSLHSSMALLVVAATQISTTRVEVPSGVWTVRIRNTGSRKLRVQAWVERDILPGESRRYQAARLVAHGSSAAGEVRVVLNDNNTLNNVATGEQVFRVGALTWLSADGQPAASPYSSAPGAGAARLEFSAVADMSVALQGIRVSGNTSASVARMNGTSVAAPQAARWIANRLAAGDSVADVRRFIGQIKSNAPRIGKLPV